MEETKKIRLPNKVKQCQPPSEATQRLWALVTSVPMFGFIIINMVRTICLQQLAFVSLPDLEPLCVTHKFKKLTIQASIFVHFLAP